MLYKINISNKTSDLLLVNEDYFISAQPINKTIIIFNIKNLRNINQEKIITNIDSIDSQDCLLKYKEYIIINCIKGIALLFIKTKEIFQYIENYIGISINKEIFLDNNDNICILNKKEINNKHAFSILKLSMNYGSLEPIEKYEDIIINEKIIKTISLLKQILVFCENNVYSLTENLSN